MKIRKWLDMLLAFLTVISFTGVIVVVMVQIMSRYLPYTAIWTEELTRYLFIYAICFGAPLALLRGEYINVDMIFAKMSHNFRRFYEIAIYAVLMVLFGVMVKTGYDFTLVGTQMSATMPFKMSAIHAAILIMSLLLAFYSIVKIVKLIRNEEDFKSDIDGGEI
ncbi:MULTISPECIES: TRAP transporter small permease [unclassified Mesobacillus]|uniref:TRAP transporter small permease n=1 Tax=unclassified Mesobacillus TaxID=2675270 RepID=UPI00203F33B4|nr:MULTISPECIES: TRAP transporter small permease [unclassified Mesobacillus]MCM3124212.1 TRAP transporter small permease [Mesobacillus sp. MER 33]MCM3234061.1 TRAP transporter small permease [Mesobacillus sp. MER 48]